MVRYFLFLTASLTGLCTTAYSQSLHAKKTVSYSNHTKTKFPLNTSAAILLVSFSPIIEGVDPGIIGDTTPPKAVIKYGKYGDTLGHMDVREIIMLSQQRTKRLYDVLNKKSCYGLIKMGACYSPRNAVLFMDRNGKVLAELEVCFECLGFETKPQDFYVNDVRECMYDALKKIFADEGVTFGIVTKQR